MNNEIKEILDNLKNKDNDIKGINFLKYQDLTRGEINLLLDYITNLQQDTEMYAQLKDEYEEEIKELHENNQNMQEEMARVWEENERLNLELSGYREAILRDDKLLGLQDYKSRCEKAIEIINFEWEEIVEDECYENHLWSVDGLVIKKLLNILQNGSDDNE